MADVPGKFFSATKVRTGVSPSSPGSLVGEPLPPVNPPGTSLNSVGLTMPSAFTVSNSPLTSNGTIGVAGAGTVGQYIRGDGSLADFPESSGGGSSVSYYLNGSVNQGTIGGVAYKELNKVPILGAGTDFTINADGYIASFITDAGDPNLLEIPGGNWNFESYFSASSSGGTPSFYVELYKYDGSTFTLIASSSSAPEFIAFGTITTPYFSSLAVPTTTLALTDRLAVRYYVNHSGRTITLHTENNHLCQIITTFTTGITALNGLTAQVQNFAVGTSGTDFNIASATATHTFNLPTASATNRGALSSADWSMFNAKQDALINPVTGTGSAGQLAYWSSSSAITGESNLFWDATNDRLGIGMPTPQSKLSVQYDKSIFFVGAAIYDSQAFNAANHGGAIGFGGTFNSSGTYTEWSSIGGMKSNTTDGNISGEINFYTRLNSSVMTERMRIFAEGQLHIGSTPLSNNGATLQVSGTATVSSFITAQSSAGGGLRIYGSSGTNQWDMYLNSANLRFSDNTGTGSIVFDRPLNGTSAVFSDDIFFTTNDRGIRSNTSDGADNKFVYICGGGARGADRGAGINLFGNETFQTGRIDINAGDVPGGSIILQTGGQDRLTIVRDGAATFGSSVMAGSFIKSGGTSAQFLKADGSVDSTTYVPTSRTITINGTTQDLSADRTFNVGTVTSVTATAGTGISISGSPITSSGTLTITNTAPDQVVSLTPSTGISISGTYPNFTITNTSPASASGITGTGTSGKIPIFTGTNTIGNSKIDASGSVIYNENPTAGQFAWQFNGSVTTGQSYGANVVAGTNSSDIGFKVMNAAASVNYFVVRGDGNVGINTASPNIIGFSGPMLTIAGTGQGQGIEIWRNSDSIPDDQDLGLITFLGGTSPTQLARVVGKAVGTSEDAGALSFQTCPSGGGVTDRMRITSGGNVLIGTTTDASGKLQVLGSNGTVIAQLKSSSGMLQFYPFFSAYSGPIIQALDGAGANLAALRVECTTMTVAGNQTVTGTKSFAIDHPLDNTKTLLHYSTESPKADLIYRGKIHLVNGKAIINIDLSSKMTEGTFVSLCRDIQCFTTNENGWDLVKGKVVGNILTIESNNANSNSEISWMVIGERNDNSIKKSNMLDKDGNLIVEKNKN